MLDALLTSTAAAETITMSGTVTIILASLALAFTIVTANSTYVISIDFRRPILLY